MAVDMTTPARETVPEHLKWDMTPVFASAEAFEHCFAETEALIPKFATFNGRLNRSGKILLAALEHDVAVSKEFDRLYFYALLGCAQDASNQAAEVLLARVKELGKKLSEACAFFRPQLASIKPERLALFSARTPGLQIYEHYLEKAMLGRPHVRSHEIEELLAQVGTVLSGPKSTFEVFNKLILPRHMPMVLTENHEQVKLNNQVYAVHLDSTDREVRRQSWEGMMRSFGDFGPVLAKNYANRVNVSIFEAKARNYGSALERSLAGPHLPVSVYDSLIGTVRANLPLVQRYLRLRQKLLGVSELHMYDLYVPLVAGVDAEVRFEDAKLAVLAAVSILGDDYVSRVRRAFNGRRIDVMPNQGKETGAFSAGIWGVLPYMLLNWAGQFGNTSTLAHELGHNMHSEYANDQAYINAGYPTFCAEVASTVNEQLLAHHQLSSTTDPRKWLYLLNEQLEAIRLTIVRQTLFAEFEREAHKMAEAGTPITLDVLNDLHTRLNTEYYGPAVVIDDLVKHEWARIPHFMNPFYVYTYATGLSAAVTIADRIIKEGQPAVDAYIGFLRDGKSKFALDSLRGAGADLSTPVPVERAFKHFEETLTAFEAELALL
jgi:oligoendopeptidase F